MGGSEVPERIRRASYDVYRHRPRRPVALRVSRRRRVLVIGSSAFRAKVSRAAPRDVELTDRLAGCDEAVVDVGAWEALRRAAPQVIGRVPVIPAPDRAEDLARALRRPFGPVASLAKRTIDVVLAVASGLVLLPVLVVAVLAIVIGSGRPVWFAQTRIGVGGVPFRFYKLRTMVRDAPDRDAAHAAYFAALVRGDAARNDGMYKLVDDERVTRVGAVLRRLSIDELPQLWNVVRGDMSLIGPRPMLPEEVSLLTVEQWARLRVRPGITGAWQVCGRSSLSFDEMIGLDVGYWQHWSPLTDVRILARTPLAVLRPSSTA